MKQITQAFPARADAVLSQVPADSSRPLTPDEINLIGGGQGGVDEYPLPPRG